jgi:hypothetical protein
MTTPDDSVPVDGAPVDDTPVDGAPVDTPPVDDAPVDDAPVDGPPVDDAPVDTTSTASFKRPGAAASKPPETVTDKKDDAKAEPKTVEKTAPPAASRRKKRRRQMADLDQVTKDKMAFLVLVEGYEAEKVCEAMGYAGRGGQLMKYLDSVIESAVGRNAADRKVEVIRRLKINLGSVTMPQLRTEPTPPSPESTFAVKLIAIGVIALTIMLAALVVVLAVKL